MVGRQTLGLCLARYTESSAFPWVELDLFVFALSVSNL
jgi:hypothetical protein